MLDGDSLCDAGSKRPAEQSSDEAASKKPTLPPQPPVAAVMQPLTPDIVDVAHRRSGCREFSSSGGGAGAGGGDTGSLITQIGRDLSINCLLRLSYSEYGIVAKLNRAFRYLIRSGEIFRLRRMTGAVEHWVYFSCNVLEWNAYDPRNHRWISVPRMPSNEYLVCADKESLAVGTELLVFGMAHMVFRYDILTNSWAPGTPMNSPRCLFGSASLGEKGIVAGGTDATGTILSSTEMYNSDTHQWTDLPPMNRARKLCSGFFMDGKFYVIGGMASNTEVLNCGEEYDLERRVWTVIPDMSSGLNGVSGAPPLVAVVKDELYAADYGEKTVKKYDKVRRQWVTLGMLPERSVSMNGWGLAFRACGDQLIVIGGPRTSMGGMIELNSWVPDGNPPRWNLVSRLPSGNFVYNCAVMSC